MRPLRLMIDGFGSYREYTELDLSDVDFFVLTGPTGSGKSTVIDALCFALYGTIPRWGKGNVIRNALAPSTAECRVCLVFEAAGGRYAAVRQLRRDARGQVHTKEARLERLDAGVPAGAELIKVLQAGVDQIAEGPDGVTAAVTELLGIGYEHFTQCVLLPQGRFAEFLQAKPADRQDLLIELLAYAVYEQVGQRARERGKLAAAGLAAAQRRLAETSEVTDADVTSAQQRVTDLAALVGPVDDAVVRMAELREQWAAANRDARQAREQFTGLDGLRMPDGVADLAGRLADADALIVAREAERETADTAEARAEQACAELTESAVLTAWRDDHARAAALAAELDTARGVGAAADEAERSLGAAVTDAEQAVTEAERHAERVDRDNRAAALAVDLHVGLPCPVCLQEVAALPHHEETTDLQRARRAVETARKAVTAARTKHAAAVKAAAGAKAAAEAGERQRTELAGRLAGAPPPTEVMATLARREAADAALVTARSAARRARSTAQAAGRDRASLATAEQQAWSDLRAIRDRFVAMGAPAVEGRDLASAWRALLDWAAGQRDLLAEQVTELDATETDLRERGKAEATALVALLAGHDIDVRSDANRGPVELAAHRERAARDLADLRTRRQVVADLLAETARHRQDQEVADLLGNLLRSDKFERWLCTEALDSLVFEASQTLMQLSGGQYELFRGERNDLIVIDHNDAGTHRPVNTLSGGETFQASLALALALSSQVVGLSGGRRDLNSMFLDEGFGTLDETTLETVAVTLERLAQETDRMVGIVTHVPTLAERVPVQFAVRRQGASSRIQRVGV
jgi:exonuclease SbcC